MKKEYGFSLEEVEINVLFLFTVEKSAMGVVYKVSRH